MKYIDIDKVRDDFINTVYEECSVDKDNNRANRIIDAFDDLPTIDAEPVRHGEWIESRSPNGTLQCECSICGDSALSQDNAWGDPIEYYKTDFCPNCGAKMTKEKADSDSCPF